MPDQGRGIWYFYQDRTHRIPQLEEAGRQLHFIRPRHFGNSLPLSMREHD